MKKKIVKNRDITKKLKIKFGIKTKGLIKLSLFTIILIKVSISDEKGKINVFKNVSEI